MSRRRLRQRRTRRRRPDDEDGRARVRARRRRRPYLTPHGSRWPQSSYTSGDAREWPLRLAIDLGAHPASGARAAQCSVSAVRTPHTAATQVVHVLSSSRCGRCRTTRPTGERRGASAPDANALCTARAKPPRAAAILGFSSSVPAMRWALAPRPGWMRAACLRPSDHNRACSRFLASRSGPQPRGRGRVPACRHPAAASHRDPGTTIGRRVARRADPSPVPSGRPAAHSRVPAL
jgi:hypothetical protein